MPESAAAAEVEVMKCNRCGTLDPGPRDLCPTCHGRLAAASVAGAGSLAQVVNAAIAGKARMDEMREFFEGVGEGDKAGIWQGTPVQRPEYREKFRKAAAALGKKRKSEEMV